jgi:putative transposase
LQARLEQAETIIEVQKNTLLAAWADHDADQRRSVLIAATEHLAESQGVQAACAALGVSRSRVYRRRQVESASEAPPAKPRPSPARALSEQERAQVRDVLNSEAFQDKSPREIYATLLDEGRYLCYWRTMYRILAEHDEIRERRNQLQHPTYTKPELLARDRNQLWSWDITKLRGPSKHSYYYLYVILDVYRRYVVGWMIAEQENAELAEQLIAETCTKQDIQRDQLTIHADRGSAMTSKSVALLLSDLGVTKTHSRPHVSNDNPYSEAQFKTLKYRPDYPGRFGSIIDARSWDRAFFEWYNNQHYHTGLALLTPADVHSGQAAEKLQQRRAILQQAHVVHPNASSGAHRSCQPCQARLGSIRRKETPSHRLTSSKSPTLNLSLIRSG